MLDEPIAELCAKPLRLDNTVELMKTVNGSMVVLAALVVAAGATAQQMFVFPAKEQSAQQQAQDEGACNSWAVQQTGFNPATAPTSPPPSYQATRGGLVRGGARGAAMGAAMGAIGGNAGRGAAMGATGGAMMGGIRRNDQRREQQAQDQAWQQQQNAARDQWRRAYAACLQGKGYTVN